MERLEDGTPEGMVLLDAGVVRDIASALSGLWQPEDEPDPERRAQLVAAARLRLYGERDTRGWYLVTTPRAHELVNRRDDAEWSVDFIRDIGTFDDAPPLADVAGLEALYHEAGIDGEAANALAWAVLHDGVVAVVSRDPQAFKHSRNADLPERLELLEPVGAVERLRIAPGERPLVGPPEGSALASATWWLA